ncbi:tRNA pseudouridine(38-40) synthase TruA [Cytophagaceae bacterium 50C-KIRBA]|uniref:tRNA pseudouridine synthase A n=1 Tax=Aquirufa beregesia TaxID=2516556 RepID=A0ABX0ERP5_9BACT|nr:tRNA pseudouridine(38-40) synthase TruA [Aquirufa beregesia]NGZ42919.1 tRNA pseudouridine(38-40) synthase TruA [Aquirufa beregesia]
MSRYLLQFSYDGGFFHGFQIQKNAVSVQSELEKALSTIAGIPVDLVGSSRTDTGVHAQEQFAHFDCIEEANQPKVDWVYRLNRILPASLAIQAIYQVPDDFHARFDALSRTYEYHISLTKDPFSREYAYWFEAPLNLEAMNQAAQILLNHQDFQSFSKVKTDVNTFDCQLSQASWRRQTNQLIFTIQGNRFLRGMVRAVVGTLIEIGLGKWDQVDLIRILASKDRKQAGRAVPAHGLHLIQVAYPEITFVSKCSS